MICHLLCKGKSCGVLGVLNNGLRVSFFYSFISSLLKSKSGQTASLRGTSCERRESCEDLQGIKKYNLSVGTECHRAFSGHHFFSFFLCQQPSADSLTKSRSFPQLSEYINPSATDTEYLSQWKKDYLLVTMWEYH